jgi:Bacterial Ig-like domain (group 1)
LHKGNPVSSVVKPSFWRSIGTAFVILSMLAAAGCGGGAGSTTPVSSGGGGSGTQSSATAKVSAVNVSIPPGSKTSVKSDNSDTTTISALVTDASNASVSGANVAFTATSGLLSQSVATSDVSGKASVTFSAGANQLNRIATITATSNGKSASSLISVTGSSVQVLVSPSTSLPSDGSTTLTLQVTAKDAGNNVIANTPVSFTQTGGGQVSITPATGNTDLSGNFTATVTGVIAGSVTLNVAAGGSTASTALNVTQAAAVNNFAIDLVNNAAVPANHVVPIALNTPLAVRVNAPAGVSNVQFVSTIGTFTNASSQILVPVTAGKATATLTSSVAGVATIQAYNPANPNQSDSIAAAITSVNPYRVTIQVTPIVVARDTTGGVQPPQASVVATVSDLNGAPVGNAAVAFSVVNPTGGGETVSPVVALTAATPGTGTQLGQATTTFLSGSLSSTQGGLRIRASVVGSAVATNTAPSGSDASIVIGGTAGSVAISPGSTVSDDSTHTYYILPMAVLVADSNNNPVSGATVSLSAWPLAWNTGGGCSSDANTNSGGVVKGWFYNEDLNENLSLDTTPTVEDGYRKFYPTGGALDNTLVAGGTQDGVLTPVNSAGGTVPSTKTTDGSGVATFNLVYPKSSALHIWDRIRASTIVQGTETVGTTNFVLPGSADEVSKNPCPLPASPWHF